MVTGSVASMIYAEPRTTLDVDLVVELGVDDAADFLALFPESEFYRPPLEVARQECARDARGHFTLIYHTTGMKADIYLCGGDSLHRWALTRRRRIEDAAAPITLASPEYVILRKLEFWREGGSPKHLRDVRAMVESGLVLDRTFLDAELRARGLMAAWDRAAGTDRSSL